MQQDTVIYNIQCSLEILHIKQKRAILWFNTNWSFIQKHLKVDGEMNPFWM